MRDWTDIRRFRCSQSYVISEVPSERKISIPIEPYLFEMLLILQILWRAFETVVCSRRKVIKLRPQKMCSISSFFWFRMAINVMRHVLLIFAVAKFIVSHASG